MRQRRIPNDDSLEEISVVVKIFTEKNILQGFSIAKEFICNELALQFDLSVPQSFLVNLHDDDFKATLTPEMLNVLDIKYQGVTFASRLIDASIINENLKTSSYTISDCATLFAFDCLILNTDRGGYHNKPNLLVDDEGFILIDHELTFYIIDSQDPSALNKIYRHLNNNNWPAFFSKHIFFNLLKYHKGQKKTLFDTFEESLRNLNITYIEQCIAEMENNEIATGASNLLIDYLRTLKQNSSKFRNILLGIIS